MFVNSDNVFAPSLNYLSSVNKRPKRSMLISGGANKHTFDNILLFKKGIFDLVMISKITLKSYILLKLTNKILFNICRL